jgi:hypothetical protein
MNEKTGSGRREEIYDHDLEEKFDEYRNLDSSNKRTIS